MVEGGQEHGLQLGVLGGGAGEEDLLQKVPLGRRQLAAQAVCEAFWASRRW